LGKKPKRSPDPPVEGTVEHNISVLPECGLEAAQSR